MSSTEEEISESLQKRFVGPNMYDPDARWWTLARPVLVIITKRDALDSSFDAAIGLCDFDLSSSAPTSEAIANAINRVRAVVMLEAILEDKSLIMAPIRGSACITQGHARREWYKKPRGNHFQQRRSKLSYKDLKIPEVGGRGTSAKQPIRNINSTLLFFCIHKFKALALGGLGEIMLEAKEMLCDCIMH